MSEVNPTTSKHPLGDFAPRFREGVNMRLGDSHGIPVDTIPTGSLSLDIALGVGGIPRGGVIEIFGPGASGKTTIAQHIIAETQKRGGTAAFIDMEHALDPAYAAACGVDVEELLISQPDMGEQALEITETLNRAGAVDVIVVDSVAALVPKAELEGDMGENHVGLMARLMSQSLRKLSGSLKQTNTALIFTNQLRHRINAVYGNPETTPGGKALKFYASVRMEVRQIESIQIGAQIVGNRTRARVVKNKIAPPFRTAEFNIMYNEGISKVDDIIDLAIELEIITRRGANYSYDDTIIAQGRENAKAFLRQHGKEAGEIETLIRQELLPPAVMPLER